MGAPVVLEPPYQHLVARLQEQHARAHALRREVEDHPAQVGREGPAAHVHDDGDAGDRALRPAAQLDHGRYQLRWQVVDDEVAKILQALRRSTPAGSGQASDDDRVERAAFVDRICALVRPVGHSEPPTLAD